MENSHPHNAFIFGIQNAGNIESIEVNEIIATIKTYIVVVSWASLFSSESVLGTFIGPQRSN